MHLSFKADLYVSVDLDKMYELALFCYLDKSETSNEKNFGKCGWLG